MIRVLLPLAPLLLVLSMGSAAHATHVASGPAHLIIHGPAYLYTLTNDRNPAVCKHMLHVFNDKFAHLWDAPPMPWSKNDRSYSANSKYAFPLIPSVKHSTSSTYAMRFSSQPTSSVFSAIHWKEGVAILGGCASSECPFDHMLIPILVAYFDFDNNGTIDTVIKNEFFDGYSLRDRSQEYLIVWRGQNFSVNGVANISDLTHPKDRALTPIYLSGAYLRPFMYAGHTYVARYVYREPGDSDTQINIVPWFTPPKTQDMLVQRYSFTGQKHRFTGMPEWNIKTVCDFEMKPLGE